MVFAISLLSVWREVRSYENKLDPLGKIQMALILSVSACLLGLISVAVQSFGIMMPLILGLVLALALGAAQSLIIKQKNSDE